MRRLAAFASGLSGDARLVRFLVKALADADPKTAEYAAEVLGKLGALSESSALLRSLLEANRTEWQAGRVFCNAKDAEVVRSIVGSNFGGTIDCIGGVVIESNDGTRKTDLLFETILSDVWRDSIKEVADALWPPQ